MLIATSEILMECKLGKRPGEVAAIAKEMVAYARSLGCPDVQFTAEDACRSDKSFLYHILQEVIEAGATTISISATTGHISEKIGDLIADMKEKIHGISNVIVSTHCQNYHGLATASMLQGVRAGARQVEVEICGSGQRATRNASMEEVVGAMEYHIKELGGAYTAINSQLINRISKMIKDHNGALIQPNTGPSGTHIFAHGQVGSSSTTNDSDLRKKGFLSFIHDLVSTLMLFYSALVVYSYGYPGSPKALVNYEDTLIKVIFVSNVFLWSGSIVMLPFASHFKDSKSVDHVGFDIFLGMLRLWLLSFVAAYCTTLYVFMQISFKYLSAFGVAGFFTIVVLPSIYIEYQRPKIVKWGKNAWGNLISACRVTLRAIPACFTKALKFCTNLSWPRFTRVMEAEKSLPSSTACSDKGIEMLKISTP